MSDNKMVEKTISQIREWLVVALNDSNVHFTRAAATDLVNNFEKLTRQECEKDYQELKTTFECGIRVHERSRITEKVEKFLDTYCSHGYTYDGMCPKCIKELLKIIDKGRDGGDE